MSIATFKYAKEKKYLALHVDTTGLNFHGYDVADGFDIVAICLMVCDLNFNVLDHVVLYNASVDESELINSTQYHGITRAVLDEMGLEEEEFVAEIVNFIIKHFCPFDDDDDDRENEYYAPIKCIGHNIGTFSLPFLTALLDKHSLSINFSVNVLDTHSVLIPTVGDLTLNQIIEIFGHEPDNDNYSDTYYKCKVFINIFKRIHKLWTKKVLS